MHFDAWMARTTVRLSLTGSRIASQVVTEGAKRWNSDTLHDPNELGEVVGANCTSASIKLVIYGIVEKNTATNATNVNVMGCILKKVLHDDCF